MFNQDILEFTTSAQHFKEFKCYTKEPIGSKAFYKFWEQERERILKGYHNGRDYIPGYFYHYLNYSPILKTEIIKENLDGQNQADRIKDFPDFWDGDYDFFHYIDQAEQTGQHALLLGSRGKGKSLKAGSMCNRNYFHIRESKSYCFAASEGYLTDDGIITKAWDNMDFIDQNTPWGKRRQVNNDSLHRRASIKVTNSSGIETEEGYKSEIIGVTVGDNIDKLRGKRGKLIILEEFGNFPRGKRGWNILRPSMEQGKSTFGLMLAIGTGGCVCAGSKVWTNDGNLVNIEELVHSQGILGYNGKGVSKENISWWQKPTLKQCYKIITNTGRTLECSDDHPILYVKERKSRKYITEFIETKDLKINNKIATINEVPIFGENKMWEPRVIGWLIGDGSYGENQSARLSNCEPEINLYLANNLDTKINLQYTTKENKVFQERRIKGAKTKLKELGIADQTKLRKTLPKDIHSYTKETICELLGGLFDTDGYVSYRKNKKRNKYLVEISISQASLKLIEEIRLLLQKLGIHGTVRERLPRPNNPKDKNSWFEYTISDGTSLLNFYNNIKLFPKIKQKRLDEIPKLYLNKKKGIRQDNGIRFETIVKIEDIGIKPVYNLTADTTHTYIANGIVTHNSEGAASEAMEELFYNPKAYKIYPVSNKWDPGMENTECAYFFPAYINYEGAYDNFGNSNEVLAKELIDKDRKLVAQGNDPHALTRRKAEIPNNPREAMMKITGTKFPVADLQQILAEVEGNPHRYKSADYIGRLILDQQGDVEWKLDSEVEPIYHFPHKDNKNMPGGLIIYEHPYLNNDNKIPYGMYIAGIDSYDHDESQTTSLGSIWVMNNITERLVAEYTGRPNSEEFYEQCRRILIYYNAIGNPENHNKGILDYFDRKNSSHLFCDQPRIVNDINQDSKVNRKKGTAPGDKINSYGRTLIAEWLLSPCPTEDNIDQKLLNMHKIRSIPLLKEMIYWNLDGNFDRVSALGMLMILKKDREKIEVELESTKKADTNSFFGRKFRHNNVFKSYK